jgi:hypothetical protein
MDVESEHVSMTKQLVKQTREYANDEMSYAEYNQHVAAFESEYWDDIDEMESEIPEESTMYDGTEPESEPTQKADDVDMSETETEIREELDQKSRFDMKR